MNQQFNLQKNFIADLHFPKIQDAEKMHKIFLNAFKSTINIVYIILHSRSKDSEQV